MNPSAPSRRVSRLEAGATWGIRRVSGRRLPDATLVCRTSGMKLRGQALPSPHLPHGQEGQPPRCPSLNLMPPSWRPCRSETGATWDISTELGPRGGHIWDGTLSMCRSFPPRRIRGRLQRESSHSTEHFDRPAEFVPALRQAQDKLFAGMTAACCDDLWRMTPSPSPRPLAETSRLC